MIKGYMYRRSTTTHGIVVHDVIMYKGKVVDNFNRCTEGIQSIICIANSIGDQPRRERGSTEFMGQGLIYCEDGTVVHIRDGAPEVRISGDCGEMTFERNRWRIWQQVETPTTGGWAEVPWPDPQFAPGVRVPYCLDDLIECMEGRLDEPKNSGRRVTVALEVEVALKLSSQRGGERVDLPLNDRSLGLNYDWFR